MKDKEKLKKEIWNYIIFETFSLFKNRRKFLFLLQISHMLPLLVLFFHFLAIYPCHLYLSVYLSVYITNWTNRNYNPSNTHLIGCTRSQDPIISLQILGFCSSYLKKRICSFSILFLKLFTIMPEKKVVFTPEKSVTTFDNLRLWLMSDIDGDLQQVFPLYC